MGPAKPAVLGSGLEDPRRRAHLHACPRVRRAERHGRAEATEGNSFYGLAVIGFTGRHKGIFAVAGTTGGVFNLAVALGGGVTGGTSLEPFVDLRPCRPSGWSRRGRPLRLPPPIQRGEVDRPLLSQVDRPVPDSAQRGRPAAGICRDQPEGRLAVVARFYPTARWPAISTGASTRLRA